MRQLNIVLVGIVLVALVLGVVGVSHAATPTPTWICPTAKTADPAPACTTKLVCAVPTQATDEVRTIVGTQVWEPYSTLTLNSAAVNCTNGAWSTVGVLGIPLASTLTPPPAVNPPTGPPVTPPTPLPTVRDYMVTLVGSPTVSAAWGQLPTNVPQCWNITNGVQSAQVCVPAAP